MKEIKTYRQSLEDKVVYYRFEMNYANDSGDLEAFKYHFHMLAKYTSKLKKYDINHNWAV